MTDAHGDDGDAQAEYDADTELQALLTRAAKSPTVHRDNADDDGGDDAHRERVHDSTDRALTEHADLLQRLKDEDNGDDDATGDV